MALSAQIVIPVGPVPITAQTFAVLLTGALLGSRLGAAAMIVYLVEGAAGFRFSRRPRRHCPLLGPTGGYLVAFPAAAFITGAFAEHGWDKRFPTAVAAMAIGSLVIMLERLGMVFACHKHTSLWSLSDQRIEVYSRRHHQDTAGCCRAADWLEAVEAPQFRQK